MQSHSPVLRIALAGILLATASVARAEQVTAAPLISDPTEMIGFAAELLQNHRYLLDDDQRTRLDALQRDGREAAKQLARAKDEDAHKQAADKQLAAAAGIAALLEAHPRLVRLDLRTDDRTLSGIGAVDLPADFGAVLLRTRLKTDKTSPQAHCVVHTFNASEQIGDESTVAVELPADGVSFVLLALCNMPAGRTCEGIDFKVGDQKWHLPVEFRVPAPGRLKLTVLDETSGQPVPAMVRLVSRLNGRTRMLANALAIQDQFESQGRASNERLLQIPGPLKGDYFCMPGPLDMDLPAGQWDLTVRRGIEHVPVRESFTVSVGQLVERTHTIKRWVDMRKSGWYSGDDQVHARLVSDADADRLMTYAKAEDVHIVNLLAMGDIFRTWFQQRGFGPEYRVIDGDYILTPGQACPRTHGQLGHTLSLNTTRLVRDPDKYFLYDLVFDQVHADGGLCGYAYVAQDLFAVHRDMCINIPRQKADFAEVLQFGRLGTDLWYRFLNAGFKITASAGSDVPWGGTLGEARVYAYVGNAPFSANAWFEALRRGRTFVTNGPMLEFHVDDAMPGDEVKIEDNRKLHVTARAWGEAGVALPAKLEIVQLGNSIKSIEPGENQKELRLEMDVEAGAGFWIAAHAVGSNGEQAHTTPIYVVRPGLRFWKHADIDAIVEQALANLKEVETIVAEAQVQQEQHRIDDDRTLSQLALQGHELLQRVAVARQIWLEMKDTVAKETPLRTAASTPAP